MNTDVEEIKNRLDILEVVQGYLKLQKAGINFRAPCPFHSDKSPSFFVSPSRQIWHCFGCGAGGDIFKFIMMMEGVEFPDALRSLAAKAGVELHRQDPKINTERQKLQQICELAVSFFEKQLESSRAGKMARDYLLGRGISEESISKWRLGYAPDTWQGLSDFLVGKGFNRQDIVSAGLAVKKEKSRDFDSFDRFRSRIMFPIFDINSQAVGFSGRIFQIPGAPENKDTSKYMNTPATMLYDKSRILYGLDKAKVETRKKDACVLVEGNVDAIMVSQAGFSNVVAVSGTALTSDHLRILKRYTSNIFISFDMDLAGDTATKRGIDMALAEGFNIKVITTGGEKDPADVIAKDASEWVRLVEGAKSVMDFYFQSAFSKFDRDTAEGKRKISEMLVPLITRVPNKIEQFSWVRKIAGDLGVNEESVIQEINRFGKEKSKIAVKPIQERQKEQLKEDRKLLLELRALSLVSRNPEILVSKISVDMRKWFSENGRLFLNRLENVKDGLEETPQGFEEFKNRILFLSDIQEPEETDLPEEINFCLQNLKEIWFKEKLKEMSFEIKKAEAAGDKERVEELLSNFNKLAGQAGKK